MHFQPENIVYTQQKPSHFFVEILNFCNNEVYFEVPRKQTLEFCAHNVARIV